MSSVAPIASIVALGAPNAGVGMDAPSVAAQQSFHETLHQPIVELQIVPGHAVDPLGSKVMERIETFYDRVQRHSVPEQAPATPSSEQVGPGGAMQPAQKHVLTEIDQALQMMDHAYSFAIETTIVSKVPTESTRTLNTIIRGQ